MWAKLGPVVQKLDFYFPFHQKKKYLFWFWIKFLFQYLGQPLNKKYSKLYSFQYVHSVDLIKAHVAINVQKHLSFPGLFLYMLEFDTSTREDIVLLRSEYMLKCKKNFWIKLWREASLRKRLCKMPNSLDFSRIKENSGGPVTLLSPKR